MAGSELEGLRHVQPGPSFEQVQSFDQEFENMNKALKLSCVKGLPVRVVRSFKVSVTCHWARLPRTEAGGETSWASPRYPEGHLECH